MDNDYTKKELNILRTLIERKGIQTIIETASKAFENPLFVCDLGYKIICYSDHHTIYDDFWEHMKNCSYSIPERIAQIMRSGDFKKIYATDEPRIGKYSFADHPFLAARIRDGSHILGHICVYAGNRPFCDQDKNILVLLCKVISYEMIYRGVSTPFKIPYYTLLTDLLEGNLTDEQEMDMRIKCLELQIPKQMFLIAINFKSTLVQATVFYIREYLMRKLHHPLSIVYKNQLILLAPESVLTEHLLEESLIGYETNIDCKIGVSNSISNLMNLQIYYKQAQDAIKITELLKLENRLCLYNRLKIYQILLYAKKEIELKYLCDPVVLEIQANDRKYHTEYLNDLEIYLNCGKNINKAAQQACVHKNSMYYRIFKMEEKFALSLGDEETCFSLQLSLKILQLINC